MSPILNDVTMIGTDQSKTTFSYALLLLHDRKVSRNISYVYEFIRRRFQKFHGTFHTCMNSYVEDCIRVSNQTRLKQYVYVKSYTYEKLHVWKVTRMKNYTYEKLQVLNIELWLVHCYTRIDSFTELLIRVCFLTWNFSYVEPLHFLSTSANHTN